MALLLDRRGGEVKITEDVVKVAVGSEGVMTASISGYGRRLGAWLLRVNLRSLVVMKPLDGVSNAAVFKIAVGAEAAWWMTPSVVSVEVGFPRIVTDMIVIVRI
jgi:hypothetical protein